MQATDAYCRKIENINEQKEEAITESPIFRVKVTLGNIFLWSIFLHMHGSVCMCVHTHTRNMQAKVGSYWTYYCITCI